MTRDRLVVGLTDTQLSEKLQLDTELTLEAAITAACNSQTIKWQQKELRLQLLPVAAVDAKRGSQRANGSQTSILRLRLHDASSVAQQRIHYYMPCAQ